MDLVFNWSDVSISVSAFGVKERFWGFIGLLGFGEKESFLVFSKVGGHDLGLERLFSYSYLGLRTGSRVKHDFLGLMQL